MNEVKYITHLNVQTNCNLSFSLIEIENLINFSLKKGLKTLSISDYQPYDFLKFYFLCKKNKIKPIWGIKKLVEFDGNKILFNFFPKKHQDYKDLNRFFYNNDGLINFHSLEQISKKCLFVLEARKEDDLEVLNILKLKIEDWFDDKSDISVYFGLNFFPRSFETLIIKKSLNFLIPFFSVKLIDDRDKKFLKNLKETSFALNFLKEDVYSDFIHYLSKEELINYFKYNLKKIIDKRFEEKFYNQIFSQLDEFSSKISLTIKTSNPSEKNKDFSILENKCNDSLNNLKINSLEKINYKSILDKELKIIKDFNYSKYFLILNDIINSFIIKEIEIGPGRGSAVSSLVSYLLNITQIDPIKHKLFFWRFLNEKREDYPDIDVDIQNQDEALNEIKKNYGEKFVSKIITKKKIGWFNALKLSLKNFNVLPVDSIFIEENSDRFNESNSESLKIKHFREKYWNVFDFANKLSKLNIGVSTHASGLIISEKNLIDSVPIKKEKDFLICLYHNDYLSNLGFRKYDFLGLTESLGFIKHLKSNKYINIPNYRNINLYDSRTWSLLNNGLLTGLFQIDTKSFKDFIKKFNPKNFQDLLLLISLNRPGSNKNIEDVLKKRNLDSNFNKDFSNEDLNLILNSTYGCIIFEEQVTQILSCCLSLDFSEAELLRKKLKKTIDKEKELEDFKIFFFEKASEKLNNLEIDILWNKILNSVPYMFNKAHATSYAYLTYYTSYLKANFFTESLSFFLNKNSSSSEKINLLLQESISMNYNIVKPEINHSFLEWIFDNDRRNLIMGFSQLNSSYQSFFNEVMSSRIKFGVFKSWKDFVERVGTHIEKVKIEDFINWVKIGLFRSLNCNSEWIILNINFLTRYIKIKKSIKYSNENNLPFLRQQNSKDFEGYSRLPIHDLNKNEWETLNFYVSYFTRWKRTYVEEEKTLKTSSSLNQSQFSSYGQKEIKIYCIVKDLRKTKTGYLIKVQDFNSIIEIFATDKFYDNHYDKFIIHDELLISLSINKTSSNYYLLKIESIDNKP
ncbi:MAG: Error-prone DNA polymerase [Mycoplasmataceae bacterium]|nr:MAG: Error-prone DNA polymerase [Mycoplasmataceae bacterium]